LRPCPTILRVTFRPAFRGERYGARQRAVVEVIRVPLPSLNRANLAKRFLQFACYHFGAAWAGLGEQYDVTLVGGPGLQLWLPFVLLVVLRRKPAVFSVHDVYPDVGVALGNFPPPAGNSGCGERGALLLSHSFVVRILSNSFRPGLRALGVPDAKMVLVYDWVDTELVHPMPRDNAFAREYNLADRFVVLYAGNLGLSQGLEHVLAAAEHLVDHPDVRFVFVGDGAGRERLKAEAEGRQLRNVQFLPFQSRDRLPEVLASAGVSLVILRRGIGRDSLPSKTFLSHGQRPAPDNQCR